MSWITGKTPLLQSEQSPESLRIKILALFIYDGSSRRITNCGTPWPKTEIINLFKHNHYVYQIQNALDDLENSRYIDWTYISNNCYKLVSAYKGVGILIGPWFKATNSSRFGCFTFRREVEQINWNNWTVLLKCDCGKEVIRSIRSVIDTNPQSCGSTCELHKIKDNCYVGSDHTGEILPNGFKVTKAIGWRQSSNRARHAEIWLTECKCGAIAKGRITDLRRNRNSNNYLGCVCKKKSFPGVQSGIPLPTPKPTIVGNLGWTTDTSGLPDPELTLTRAPERPWKPLMINNRDCLSWPKRIWKAFCNLTERITQ